MRRLLLIAVLLLCTIPLASAENLTASWPETLNISGNYSTYTNPNYMFDDNTGTAWAAVTGSSDFWWDNEGRNITGVFTYADRDSTNGFRCRAGSYSGTSLGELYTKNRAWNYSAFTTPTTADIYCYGNPAVIFYEFRFVTGYEAPPNADFTAAPESGAASLYVMFNDTSTSGVPIETYNWSVSPSLGVLWDNWSSPNPAGLFTVQGNYSVTHCIETLAGLSDCASKNVTVFNATTDYVTTGFAAMDSPRWVQLANASISLYDVQNASWKNVTNSVTGYEEITTVSNHTINAYASMIGYSDAELLSQPAWGGGTYTLLMFPEGYANVTAGNVTLYINIWDTTENAVRLPGATVNIAYRLGGIQQNDYQITDSSGMVEFIVPNQTTIYIYAYKAGYNNGGTTINSGTGDGGDASVTADISLVRTVVTVTTTATAAPGETIPVTADPYPCVGDGSYQDTLNCQRKQTEMASDVIQYAPLLIQLFILATIVGVIKIMGKK